MRRRTDHRSILPLSRAAPARAGDPTGDAFRSEWIDFEHGIRVGNLEPQERITQILKFHLERDYGVSFVTDRWGRGTFWQWICWLPKPNREAKPLSSRYNFGCAKLFISVDRKARVFQCGLQIERGVAEGQAQYPGTLLDADWDWHRLMAGARSGSALEGELERLLRREGFVVEVGDFEHPLRLDATSLSGPSAAAALRKAGRAAPKGSWASFQLYYPMPESEVRASPGGELVRAIRAAFDEVVPTMNQCMQVPISRGSEPPRIRAHGTVRNPG